MQARVRVRILYDAVLVAVFMRAASWHFPNEWDGKRKGAPVEFTPCRINVRHGREEETSTAGSFRSRCRLDASFRSRCSVRSRPPDACAPDRSPW